MVNTLSTGRTEITRCVVSQAVVSGNKDLVEKPHIEHKTGNRPEKIVSLHPIGLRHLLVQERQPLHEICRQVRSRAFWHMNEDDPLLFWNASRNKGSDFSENHLTGAGRRCGQGPNILLFVHGLP